MRLQNLGYACTTHTAQGVTADTMHGLLTGDESRQLAYTMLTRGREANHAYVVVVGDGDTRSVIRPETINPLSPTDVLERIMARDESPVSATTQLREAANPRVLLGEASARYNDAIGFAAEHHAGDIGVRGLERAVDDALPRLTDATTWPALRAQLLLVQADGRDPIEALSRACADPLTTAHDPCSVLAWRVADAEWRERRGPLPWMAPIPDQLADHPLWGVYLTARHHLVAELADKVRADTLNGHNQPQWVSGIVGRPPADLVADVEVWRASHQVDVADHRPTGDRQHGLTEARWQAHLERRLATSQSAALTEWRPLLSRISPAILDDEFAATLAARLSQIASSGINTSQLLRLAAGEGALPDDHAAAALWWRMSRHLSPAVAEAADTDHHIAAAWLPGFTTQLGAVRSADLQASPWWPTLVTTIEKGLQRGWQLDQLLAGADNDPDGHTDPTQAWVWRLSLLTEHDEMLDHTVEDPRLEAPEDLYEGWEPTGPTTDVADPGFTPTQSQTAPEPPETADLEPDDEQILAFEALVRKTMQPPEPTDADLRQQLERRDEIAASPVPAARLVAVNRLAADFYTSCLPGSWARPYLAQRLRATDDQLAAVGAGYAPDGWSGLVSHLRRLGVSDTEMLAAGVAQTASTGRLIDRFRDRAVFPIIHEGDVLGFVARRNPNYSDDDQRGPKYLNTATTSIFHKGDQLYVAGTLTSDTTPVLAEGPLDAIAISLAGNHIGVAPLGTSLTEQQVAQLHRNGRSPVVATDADLAGRLAAERDYWLLALYNLNPTYASLPDGTDPAELLAAGEADQITDAINAARPLAEVLIDERLAHHPEPAEAALDAARVLAAQPPTQWTAGAEHIAEQTGLPASLVRSALASLVRAWNTDPRRAATHGLQQATDVKQRLYAAANTDAARRAAEKTSACPGPRPATAPTTPPTPRPAVDR